MNFLKKIQNLPLKQRKTILWIVVSIFAVFFLFLLFQNIEKSWEGIKSIPLPSLEEEIQEISEEKTEGLENLEGENSPSFEMTPEMKESLEKLLEDSLKALRESE